MITGINYSCENVILYPYLKDRYNHRKNEITNVMLLAFKTQNDRNVKKINDFDFVMDSTCIENSSSAFCLVTASVRLCHVRCARIASEFVRFMPCWRCPYYDSAVLPLPVMWHIIISCSSLELVADVALFNNTCSERCRIAHKPMRTFSNRKRKANYGSKTHSL